MASPEYDFYRIRGTADPEAPVYWSKTLGWVDRTRSDLFTDDEKAKLNLPEDAEWVGVMFDNQYRCEECNTTWSDTWTCACNDKCPECNAEIEPESYEEYDDV